MKIEDILTQVKNGKMDIDEAKSEIESPLGYANIDYDREKRTGAPEVIFGAGKTAKQIEGIISEMLAHHQDHILATRVDKDKALYLKERFPSFTYDEEARTFLYAASRAHMNKGLIAVVCAGTSDLPVAKEASITASFLGNRTELIADVGVAGIHRLFARLDDIRQASVIIVIAGMEGALASVVAGLVDVPVIAVPTSVGYGASFHGLSALLSMLNSCANGVSVVNIDNGFGAGYNAHIINKLGGQYE